MDSTGAFMIGPFLLLLILTDSSRGECEFPRELRGRWFEKDAGEIAIFRHQIDKKGTCEERRDNLFLLKNQCYQCIEILHRHHNVVQYTTSFCVGKDSLEKICDQLDKNVVHTLVRSNAGTIQCPFIGGFNMGYTNNSGGRCEEPKSYAKPCANDNTYMFNFKKCPNTGYTYDKDWVFECLATWNEDRGRFLYGRVTGPDLERSHKDISYRCAMYQVMGSFVYIALSDDATCRGIRDVTNGPITMELTKDRDRWYENACTFPSWVHHNTWRDLSGHHVYRGRRNREEIEIIYRKRSNSAGSVRTAFRCIKPTADGTSDDKFVGVSFTSNQCSAVRQCIRMTLLRTDLMLIEEGKTGGWSLSYCTDDYFENASQRLLFPDNIGTVPCPFNLRHKMMDSVIDCHVSGNCHNKQAIEFSNSCEGKLAGLEMNCLMKWSEGDSTYLIAQNTNHMSKQSNVYKITEGRDKISIFTSRKYNIGVSNIIKRMFLPIRLEKGEDACVLEPATSTLTFIPTLASSLPPDPGIITTKSSSMIVIRSKDSQEDIGANPESTKSVSQSKEGFSYEQKGGPTGGASSSVPCAWASLTLVFLLCTLR